MAAGPGLGTHSSPAAAGEKARRVGLGRLWEPSQQLLLLLKLKPSSQLGRMQEGVLEAWEEGVPVEGGPVSGWCGMLAHTEGPQEGGITKVTWDQSVGRRLGFRSASCQSLIPGDPTFSELANFLFHFVFALRDVPSCGLCIAPKNLCHPGQSCFAEGDVFPVPGWLYYWKPETKLLKSATIFSLP